MILLADCEGTDQAELSLRFPHIPEDRFVNGAAHSIVPEITFTYYVGSHIFPRFSRVPLCGLATSCGKLGNTFEKHINFYRNVTIPMKLSKLDILKFDFF